MLQTQQLSPQRERGLVSFQVREKEHCEGHKLRAEFQHRAEPGFVDFERKGRGASLKPRVGRLLSVLNPRYFLIPHVSRGPSQTLTVPLPSGSS